MEVWLEVFFGDVKAVEVGASPSDAGDIEIVIELVIEFDIAIESVAM
ncbi:MAG: hypothetical protein R2828_04820 [Saprospiraceae bacterium]